MGLWITKFVLIYIIMIAVMHWPKRIIIVMLLCNQWFETHLGNEVGVLLSVRWLPLLISTWLLRAAWTSCDMWVYWEEPEATHLCTGSLRTRLAVHVRTSWWIQTESAPISKGKKTWDIILKGEFLPIRKLYLARLIKVLVL